MLLKLVTTSPPRLLQSRNVELTHPLELAHSPSGQERVVHTIYFKILSPDSPHRALFIHEINQRGYIKQFEPEFFLMKLTGDQTLANRLADYSRQFYGIPTVHPGSPFDPPDQQCTCFGNPGPADFHISFSMVGATMRNFLGIHCNLL